MKSWSPKGERSLDAATKPSFPGAKKILIHYTVLKRGGAERSIVRLVAAMVDRGCEVHLVLTVPGGELEREVDARVQVHHLRTLGLQPTRGRTGLGTASHVLMRIVRSLRNRWDEWHSFRQLRHLEFDLACVGRAGMSYAFVCNKVNATKRLVFVRSDPSAASNQRWQRSVERHDDKIDYYACVSAFVRMEMERRFPFLSSKLSTSYNLIDSERIRKLASASDNPFQDASSSLRVLSVCRLHEAPKGLLRMVKVHRRLLDAGFPHIWHVLGDGPDRALLEKSIVAYGVADTFVLHGDVANPFPYYQHADICAVLSRYEGLCGVVNEARVLERAVIATRFSGIDEQIENGVNGLIVEQDVQSISEGLASLMRDAQLRVRLAKGGFPSMLSDDEAKIDAFMGLIS